MTDYSEKHIIISGGSSGINLGIALEFARHGAEISIIARNQEKLTHACEQISVHSSCHGYSADVRDDAALVKAIESAVKQAGSIDVLIAGAAGNFPAAAMEMSTNAFKSVIDIDLIGTFNLIHAAYSHLTKPGARVINISAPQSTVPVASQAHVCAAKAGIDMLTRVLALEWSGQGITINSIIPGPINDTEGMARLAPSDELQEMVRQSVPSGRLGEVSDIAKFAVLLASDECDFINGAILPVDGGWSLQGVASFSIQMTAMMKKMELSRK